MNRILVPDLLYRDGAFHEGLALEYSPEAGRIVGVVRAADVRDGAQRLCGRALLPGLVNTHSHAFQRLIRGRTQWRPRREARDDFWSWRSAMYAAANALEPDDVFAVSRFCFLEMLRAGYTSVGEFHYLHRDPAGEPYADAIELSKRVIEAAEAVGLRIRLLHVAYATGGIGEALKPEQRRFATPSLEGYLADVEALVEWAAPRPLAAAGLAPHSVRAVPIEWLEPLRAYARVHALPLHIHASEQPAEVAACQAAYGRRPVELLGECGVLDARTTIVHATHLSAREVSLLCGDATVCACPTTERDLGDGFLDTGALYGSGARIAIGSDSQTVIDPFEEVRLLEYHERMRALRRVILAEPAPDGRLEVGSVLLDMASAAGARAIRVDAGALEPGGHADFVAIDLEHAVLAGWTAETLASLITLCASADVVADVWIGGVQRLENRRHALDDDAAAAFRAVARRLE